MCKKYENQLRAIEIAKRETVRVTALYEVTDYGRDLIALVEVLDEFATLFRRVDDDGDLSTVGVRKPDFPVTKRSVLDALGIAGKDDYQFMRGFYRLIAC